MGVPTTTMRATHFGEWVGGVGSPSKSDRGGKAKPLLLRQHLTECLDKGSRFAERDVKIRPAATDDDDDAPFRFFTYKIAPLFHKVVSPWPWPWPSPLSSPSPSLNTYPYPYP